MQICPKHSGRFFVTFAEVHVPYDSWLEKRSKGPRRGYGY